VTVLDWQSTSPEVAAAQAPLAILPIGQLRSSAPDLPLDLELRLLAAIAHSVAERIDGDTYVLPTWPFGQNSTGRPTDQEIGLLWRTLLSVVGDLGSSLFETEFRRLAVLVGLGSADASTVAPVENHIVKTAVRRLNYDHGYLDALWVQPLTVAEPPLSTVSPGFAGTGGTIAIVRALARHLWPESPACAPGDGQMDGSTAMEAIVHGTAHYIEETLVQMAQIKDPQRTERDRP